MLAAAVIPLLVVSSQGTRSVDAAGRRMLVASLARTVLENLKTRRYGDVRSEKERPVLEGGGTSGHFAAFMHFGEGKPVALDEQNFPELALRLKRLSYVIDVEANTPLPGMKVVTVTFLEGAKPRQRQMAYSTILWRKLQ